MLDKPTGQENRGYCKPSLARVLQQNRQTRQLLCRPMLEESPNGWWMFKIQDAMTHPESSSGLVLFLLFPGEKKNEPLVCIIIKVCRGPQLPSAWTPPPPAQESPETSLIISPVFALRPHGQASKTSGQIGVYECKHPACHTVSVSERVDVDKKQLDGDSQSSQTPRRHGFWSSLPSHGLSVFVSKNKKTTDEGLPSCHMTWWHAPFCLLISLTPHAPIPLRIHGCSSVVAPFTTTHKF